MTHLEENCIINTCSKKKIIQQEFDDELKNVSFAIVEFTIKTKNKSANNNQGQKWKIRRIRDTVIKYYENNNNGTKEFLNEIKILNFINTEIKNDDLKVPETFYYKLHKKDHTNILFLVVLVRI